MKRAADAAASCVQPVATRFIFIPVLATAADRKTIRVQPSHRYGYPW